MHSSRLEARIQAQHWRCINIRPGRLLAPVWSELPTVRRALDNRALSRRSGALLSRCPEGVLSAPIGCSVTLLVNPWAGEPGSLRGGPPRHPPPDPGARACRGCSRADRLDPPVECVKCPGVEHLAVPIAEDRSRLAVHLAWLQRHVDPDEPGKIGASTRAIFWTPMMLLASVGALPPPSPASWTSAASSSCRPLTSPFRSASKNRAASFSRSRRSASNRGRPASMWRRARSASWRHACPRPPDRRRDLREAATRTLPAARRPRARAG